MSDTSATAPESPEAPEQIIDLDAARKARREKRGSAPKVLFFGETYLAYSTVLAEDAVLVVRGRVRRRDEQLQLQANEVSLPDISAGTDAPLLVSLPVARCTPPVVERLREVLGTHPGVTEVRLRLTSPGRATVMRLGDGLRVERTPALFGDLKALLGPSCLAS